MKIVLIAGIFFLCSNSFSCSAMGKDEKFMTRTTKRWVTISEYNPQEDGALYSLAEWESRWGKIKNSLDEQRATDTPDTFSESLATSTDPLKPQSPRSKTPPILQALNSLKTTEKKHH